VSARKRESLGLAGGLEDRANFIQPAKFGVGGEADQRIVLGRKPRERIPVLMNCPPAGFAFSAALGSLP